MGQAVNNVIISTNSRKNLLFQNVTFFATILEGCYLIFGLPGACNTSKPLEAMRVAFSVKPWPRRMI